MVRLANETQRVVLELPGGVTAERTLVATPQSLQYRIVESEGVAATLSDGRTVRFAGFGGEMLTLPTPRIIDAEGKSTTRARWEAGERTLTLTIDDEHLVYPITIDMTASGPKPQPRRPVEVHASGGSISGTMTDSYTGEGIAKELVHVYNPQQEWIKSAITDANGNYLFQGIPAGTYYVAAVAYGYHSETYDNIACSTRPCTITGATPVNVVELQTTGNINFQLTSKAARVSGKVTDAGTGAPLAGVAVMFTNAGGSRAGVGFADEHGNYVADVAGTGTFYARTWNHTYKGFIDQRYASTDCVDCNPALGTPIGATLGKVTEGIDFSLSGKGGSISGTLTDSWNGAPLKDKFLHIYNSAGHQVTYATSDAAGNYQTFHGLVSDKYYVAVTPSEYHGEVFNNVSCPANACNPLLGLGVTVKTGDDTPGVNFSLRHRKSRVIGRLTDLAARVRMAHVKILFYDYATLEHVATAATDEEGFYEAVLDEGSYYVKTQLSHLQRGFVDQLYPGIPCTQCSIREGQAIAVKEGMIAEKIDFKLSVSGGKIAGTLFESRTRAAIPYKHVELYDSKGEFLTSATSSSRGTYIFEGIAGGEYYVLARPHGFVPQVYPGVNCGDDCDVVKNGRSVGVKDGSITEGVDFALLNNVTRISGFVVDAATGAAIASEVAFFNRLGEWAGSATTNAKGEYKATLDSSGVFYAQTFTTTGNWTDQIFSGFECEGTKCDPTNGTPIEAGPEKDVTNVGFYLRGDGGRLLSLRSTSTNTSYGETVTFTASVEEPADSGEFRLYSGQKLLATKPAVNGSSSFDVTTLPAGVHSIVAEYVDGAGSERSALRHSVRKGQRKIELKAEGATFTAKVNHSGEPTQITFRNGDEILGTVTTEEDGTATLTGLPNGSYRVTATVAETPNYEAGASEPVEHEVKKLSRRRGV
ncbi:MAG TPA: carboxypeptidase regulatory-like domain-containing protein [Thermoanaerobaculia bacterium]